jgi:hypothetical protein
METPWIDADELPVVRGFVNAGVRFVIVGGRAVQFYDRTRKAKDLDLLVEYSAENWKRLESAMPALDAGVPAFVELDAPPKRHGRFQYYPTVEILTAVCGVQFAEAWSGGAKVTFEGLDIRVLSKEHIILSKERSARPVDISDVRRLRRAE